MAETRGIDEIRRSIDCSTSAAEKASEYVHLILHDDVTWADLLNALEYKMLSHERAAIELHLLLGVEAVGGSLIYDRRAWEEILVSRDMGLFDRARS